MTEKQRQKIVADCRRLSQSKILPEDCRAILAEWAKKCAETPLDDDFWKLKIIDGEGEG